ncbi:MAG: S41 family peptidase [Candidatus Omnitrophica bacterium]|nr:S41 family peptidase [Candidatus Omnitrophota bacterium]
MTRSGMMMSGKLLLILMVVGCLSFGIWLLPIFAQDAGPSFDILEELKLYSKALGAIVQGYVEDKNPRELFYDSVRGMLKSLDEYCEFFSPDQYELVKISMKGEYSGIGAKIEIVDHYPSIAELKPDSAAMKAGLEVHDRILKVDGVSMMDKAVGDVSSLLRGDVDTALVLTIFREATQKTFDVKIIREKVVLEAVKDVRMVGRALGYMRISEFQEKTAEQAKKALRKLHGKKMGALILDLRGNIGGLLPEAIELAELFLPDGVKIVTVKSKIPEQRNEYYSKAKEVEPFYPMIILVNEATASASEIFTGAMQDHGRAKVIGTKTYGKASVQSVIPLDEKSAMKITTARYITPNGRIIDKVGIVPDEVIENKPAGTPGYDVQTSRALELFQQYI